jgi:hypothetical protein
MISMSIDVLSNKAGRKKTEFRELQELEHRPLMRTYATSTNAPSSKVG